ncbi:uncharacterized protein LOC129237216 [Anastrepha obliqua]|uniref:uncharacterized protein LOC129237216 n=1 Tax=Anastrepha obliqua TaxID=95512 RepID=UPI0024096ECC|nr:uncharacterized protein LOC129237216 [Anastrepha obliqua]
MTVQTTRPHTHTHIQAHADAKPLSLNLNPLAGASCPLGVIAEMDLNFRHSTPVLRGDWGVELRIYNWKLLLALIFWQESQISYLVIKDGKGYEEGRNTITLTASYYCWNSVWFAIACRGAIAITKGFPDV